MFHFCAQTKRPNPTSSWNLISSDAFGRKGGPCSDREGRDGQPPQGGFNSSGLLRKERQNPVQRASEKFLCTTGVLMPYLDAGIGLGCPCG